MPVRLKVLKSSTYIIRLLLHACVDGRSATGKKAHMEHEVRRCNFGEAYLAAASILPPATPQLSILTSDIPHDVMYWSSRY